MRPRHRLWATISLAAGAIWLVFSMLPTVITTIIGLPVAAVALAGGWWARGRSRAAGDAPAARRAGWGLGLGCLGCLWQVAYYVVLAGAGLAALSGAIGALLQAAQTTPVP